MAFKEQLPVDFGTPTALPETEARRAEWQEQNRSWWENHPMRYDWRDPITAPEFSREFYDEIDRRFFSESEKYIPRRSIPFDALVDFDALRQLDVLEIGVGNGSHAQLLTTYARTYTGIDLTEYAVKSTSTRLKQFKLRGEILRMDAERMGFPSGSFDLIWSWGVIHHSANTRRILEEMHRVLRPGGRAVTMIYHRNFWNYYIVAGLFHGILRGQFIKRRSLHEILQNQTDGAIARYYSVAEWKALVSDLFSAECIILGSKAELFPLPAGVLKNLLMNLTPDAVSRFFTNRLGWGAFLVSKLARL